jgi:tripartite-type tricarboxylate transporter receptor subunit TctC
MAARRLNRRAALALFAFTATLGLISSPALAQPYPAKPVRVVVGFAPGGPTDIVARLVAKHLTDDLGQSFVVDNKAGAAGNIGTTYVAKAANDGYTLLVSGINLVINPYLTTDIKVDSRKDLRAVKLVSTAPTVLVVRNNFPAANFKEFIAEVRANPGKYSGATPGATTMATALYNELAKSRIVLVPYKGAAPALTDLMAGHVDLSFATLGSVLPQIKAGKIRALAVASPQRDPMLLDIPTFAESGLPNFRFDAWSGVLVPAGTPDEIVTRLSQSLDKLLANPAYAQQLADAGLRPVRTGSPADFAKLIDEELGMYEKLAAQANAAVSR